MEHTVYSKLKEFKKRYPLTVGWRLKSHCKVIEKHLNPGEIVNYVFVSKKNDKWYAFGLPYDITFDKDLLYQLKSEKINLEIATKISKYESNKIRFDISEFVNLFETEWVWHAPISTVNFVNLSKENIFLETLNISFKDIMLKLDMYGKDKNFSFGDYLKINNLYPLFKYETFSREVNANKLEGNILKYYYSRRLL